MTACIGVFDSGVGGLSVLRSLHAQLPHAPLLYVADSAHAPYGERSDDYVLDRSRRIMDHLLAEGAIGLVIACNTATAIAVAQLREANDGFPIVGVEPGLKPAVTMTRNGRVGVMATPATIASAKFRALVQAQGAGVTIVAQPCPGLARLIEEGDLRSARLREAIVQHTEACRGCRHRRARMHALPIRSAPHRSCDEPRRAVHRHRRRSGAPRSATVGRQGAGQGCTGHGATANDGRCATPARNRSGLASV